MITTPQVDLFTNTYPRSWSYWLPLNILTDAARICFLLNIHNHIQQPARISSLFSDSNCIWKIRNDFKSTSLEHLGSICRSSHESLSCMLIVQHKTRSLSVWWCSSPVLITLLQAQIQMARYCKTQIGHTCSPMLTEISRWRPTFACKDIKVFHFWNKSSGTEWRQISMFFHPKFRKKKSIFRGRLREHSTVLNQCNLWEDFWFYVYPVEKLTYI